MTRARANQTERSHASATGAEAFRQALHYALAVTEGVTPELMPRPTPCRGWDLRMLLMHAAESLAALKVLQNACANTRGSPVGLTGQDADNLFAAGKAAIEWNGPWALTGFQKAGIDPPKDNMSVDDLTTLGVNLKEKLPDVWPIRCGA